MWQLLQEQNLQGFLDTFLDTSRVFRYIVHVDVISKVFSIHRTQGVNNIILSKYLIRTGLSLMCVVCLLGAQNLSSS